MELITILKAPAAIAVTLFMGYLMIRTIIWIQIRQDQITNQDLNKEQKND
jgi:hypothetical protein